MIEKWLVSRLDTIVDLAGKSYPTAAPVGDTAPPFAIYTLEKEVTQRDMAGELMFYAASFRVDLFDADNDYLCTLAAQAEQALTCQNVETEDGYIFSSDACRGNPAGFDLRLETHAQPIMVTIRYWR